MTDITRIKVLPNADEAIGIVHPVDGPLAAEGSLWSFDTFTMRRLLDGGIRRAETEPGADGAKPAGDATASGKAAASK